MSNSIEKILANVESLRQFYRHFTLPDDIYSVAVNEEGVVITINCRYGEREKYLAICGQVLGTEGWTKKPNYNKAYYDWCQTFYGVDVCLSYAEELPPLVEQPVRPREFPLMLEEV